MNLRLLVGSLKLKISQDENKNIGSFFFQLLFPLLLCPSSSALPPYHYTHCLLLYLLAMMDLPISLFVLLTLDRVRLAGREACGAFSPLMRSVGGPMIIGSTMGISAPRWAVLNCIRKQTEEAIQTSLNPRLQAPVLFEFLPWLHSMMKCGEDFYGK